MSRMASVLGVVGLSLLGSSLALAQDAAQNPPMTFFLTSEGAGEGSNLGGLTGADAHCQRLATRSEWRQPHLARLPQHARPERRQCSRPHRHGPMA